MQAGIVGLGHVHVGLWPGWQTVSLLPSPGRGADAFPSRPRPSEALHRCQPRPVSVGEEGKQFGPEVSSQLRPLLALEEAIGHVAICGGCLAWAWSWLRTPTRKQWQWVGTCAELCGGAHVAPRLTVAFRLLVVVAGWDLGALQPAGSVRGWARVPVSVQMPL